MDSFNQRKISVLEKKDKAAKGSWDERIIELCNKLNSLEEYYTTSSCSGKSVIMEEKIGKDGSYYLWENHELLVLDELIWELKKIKSSGIVKFKSESPVLFVVCQDIESAEKLFFLARKAGFKQTGIHKTRKLIGVEIRSGEKLEFPFIKDGKLLGSEEFLLEIVNQSNFRRKLGWEKIERLFNLFN